MVDDPQGNEYKAMTAICIERSATTAHKINKRVKLLDNDFQASCSLFVLNEFFFTFFERWFGLLGSSSRCCQSNDQR